MSVALIAAGATVVASATSAQAAVVKAFTQDYSAQLYGDFLEVGNSSVVCPTSSTTDPVADISGNGSKGNTVAQCTTAQQRGQQNFGNDAYRMIQANPSTGVLNSSQATLTIPPGATVAFARLNWSANTGVMENANANGQLTYPSCGSGDTQANPAVNPTGFGTYSSNPVKLVANGQTTSYTAGSSLQTDPTASLAANSPQYYSAYANVTSQFAGVTTGSAIPITVQNVWGPSGFNCYAGWSLTVVYSYPTANATYAPLKRQVYVYNGHVRQQATDTPTDLDIPNLRLSTSDSHVGITAYEGDYNISGDQLLVNGTAIADPLTSGATANTNNFFVGNAEGNGSWSNGTAGGTFTAGPPNVFSIDAKEFQTSAIVPQGSAPSTADLQFKTSGDSYLAQEVVLSSPLPEIRVTKQTTTTVARAGGTAQFQIQVSNPTPSPLTNVVVTDTQIAACDNNSIGNLAGNSTITYTCTGTVPNDGSTSFTNTVTTSGNDYTGTPVTGTATSNPITVIHPSISLTKTADKALYTAGGTVTFTITAKNTGDATLTGVKVTDTNAANCASTIGTLAAGATSTYTCTTTAPVAGGSNTASVVGTDPTNQTVTATANAPAPTAGSVNGTVFADSNNNGAIDGSDTGIPGVTLSLRSSSGTTVTTTTTSNGGFSFPTVAPGTYTLTETQPAGYAQGKDTAGTNSVASGQDAFTVTVPDNGASAGNLFGEVPSDSLAGVVYVDANNDGVKASSETGIGGVAVNLTGTDDGGNAVTLSTLTAADGSYSFAALRPGVYTITEIQPAGYVQGKDAAGTPAGNIGTQDKISGITLSGSNTAGTGYNFGELVAASISGQVFTDKGTPLAGVALTVTGTDDTGAAVSKPVTTDANGGYIVTGLRPGSYTVTETQPTAYGAGSVVAGSAGGAVSGANAVTTITLASGTTATGYNFTETTASLAGTVFSDPNNNGTKDAGETGIGGVTVTLTGTGSDGRSISKTTTTATDGTYSFTDLPAGTSFKLVETQPTAYLTGKNTAGTFGGAISGDTVSNIAVTAGTAGTGYTFGEVQPASVTGVVTDQSGNPESGITMTLGGSATATTTTAADGSYGFTNLYPGTYTVTETQPAGLGDGTDTVGVVNGGTTPVGSNTGTPNTVSAIVLPAGGAGTGYNFTDVAGSLSGHVYVDANNNGTFDNGETPIAGVTVSLSNGTTTKTTTTAADGSYTFGGLAAGTYSLTETQPAGYVNGSAHVGTVGTTTTGTASTPDSITSIALTNGGAGTSYDFGELKAASIAGTVKDDTGAPIAGVTITLTPTAGGTARTTTTAADGTWSFTGVTPGSYSVTETQPTAYGDTATTPATAGTSGGTVSGTNAITAITLASNATATGYAFVDSTSTLSGFVYVDANGNGTKDASENGIGGVTVTLTGGPANVTKTATTDASGAYSFTGLVAGNYTVTEAQPTSYSQGTDKAGTTPNGTIAQTSTSDTISAISVGAGVTLPGYLFGEFTPTGLSGTVRDDQGNSLAGVTVNVLNSSGTVVATTTTLANGTFGFTSLPPGTYSIQEVQPAGYGAGSAVAGTVGGTTDGTPSTTDPNLINGVTIASGQTGINYTFIDTSGSLAGRVFLDKNGNNAYDAGTDTGIGSVTLTATATINGVVTTKTTTTAADGTWSFTGLAAGTWKVTETQPNGYTSGTDTAGSPVNGTAATDGVTISAITVAAGTAYTGYLYPEYTLGSLAGVVRDSAGNPLGGVTITVGGPTPKTTTTAADGTWSVTGLQPGTYTVTETQPADYGDGTSAAGSLGGTAGTNAITAVPVTAGASGTNYNFTDTVGSLAGTVFFDKNNNGTIDAGEPGIANVTVTVTGTTTGGVSVSKTATTAADGTWTVTGLPRGTYQLVETQPTGYTTGIDTAGTSGGTLSTTTTSDTFSGIALGLGQAGTGYLFGEYTSATLSGTVRDQNLNGLPTATLTITDGAGHTYTPTIAANGTWTVTGIVPGTYSITETNPTGYGNVSAVAGNDGGTVVDPDHITGVVVGAGSTGSGYVFVDRVGSISGVVYLDSNGNGVQDGSEAGISGVTVTLTGASLAGPVVATTNAGGAFSFTNLKAGAYTLTETQPAGYAQGADTVGTVNGAASGNAATQDVISGITLTAGSTATSMTGVGYKFGEQQFASISGSVLLGTAPEVGTTVTLTSTTDTTFSRTTTTASDGTYSFTSLPPGTYVLTESTPAAYSSTSSTPGTVNGSATGAGSSTDADHIAGIVLPSSGTGAGYVFTDAGASIAGLVFDDVDGNNVQGANEPGIPGVTVTLTDATTGFTRSTTTGSDGSFTLTNLPANLGTDTYTLTETQPASFISGTDNPGTTGGTAQGDGTTITGITLAAGVSYSGVLYPEQTNGALAGTVRDDQGNPLAGVTITLHNEAGGTDQVTTTATDGSWSFGTVPAGTYDIVESQPVQYGNGSVTAGSAGGTANPNGNEVDGVVTDGNTHASGYDFVDTSASVAGRVYVDANGNGTYDTGEQLLSGVTVTVTGSTPTVTKTVTTAADGTFDATGLPSGTYTVTETQPTGYLSGTDVAGTPAGGTAAADGVTFTGVAVAPGSTNTGYLYGEYKSATISGVVTDTTGAGIAGATVTLKDGSGNVVGTPVTTGADGSWSFTVAPGTYASIEANAPGYGDVSASAGTAGGTVTDPNTITSIPLTSGQTATGYTFVDTLGGISGTVYVDTNDDGAYTAGTDLPIANATVTLTGTTSSNTPIDVTTLSLSNGTFRFTNVPAGTYTLTETQPAGYAEGTDTAGVVGGVQTGDTTTQDVISGITLLGGQSGTGYLFGERKPGSLSGVVDIDAVGGTAENGITVTLSDGGANVYTTTTTNGAFSFPSVAPGTYTLTETQPAAYGTGSAVVGSAGGTVATGDPNTITGITIAQSTAASGYAFVDTSASLGGTVFVDTNNDGTQQSGELGISGVTVTVTGGGSTYTATTDGDGNWSVTGLPALATGTYTITETQPAGYLSGIDTVGNAATPGTAVAGGTTFTGVSPSAGQQAVGYLFGEYQTGSVSGTVVDSNGNPIAGVTVTLNGPSNDGATFTTGPDGAWTFTGLTPGSYTVTETQPADYGAGSAVSGTLHGTPNGPNQLTGIAVTSGSAGTGAQFIDTLGSLRTTVYVDSNNNGTKDAGEVGIAGVTVKLTGTVDGNPITEVDAQTDSTGVYTFTGLKAGTYTITEVQPTGYAQGKDSAGNPAGSIAVQDVISGIPLAGGQAGTTYRFGEQQLASIAGTVSLDGAPESGIQVNLTGTTDTGLTVSTSVQSQPDGTYTFAGLSPGTYAVSETQPTQYGAGTATRGTAGGTVSGANAVTGITIAAGDTATGYAFTDTSASIAGTVFVDANGNNAKNAGENGLGGVVVDAVDGTGAVVASATTASDGTFTITGLQAGTYTVQEHTQPAGYSSGTDGAGNTGGTVTGDTITNVAVAAGGSYSGVLFPEFVQTTLSGNVSDDAGHGIQGVTITISGPALAAPVTVTTDSNGDWTSPALPPGTYKVVETQPGLYGAGSATVGDLGGTVSGANTITNVVVTSGNAGSGYDFTDTLGSLSGVVFADTNGDGVQNGTEAGIGNVKITVTDPTTGDTVGSATTLADGSWTVTGLLKGTYTITETQPAGYASGKDTPGSSGGTAAADGVTFTNVKLGAGLDSTGYLYAEYVASTISGSVSDDAGNPLANVTITISGPTLAAPVTATTDNNGNWTSPALPPGTYTVTETQPALYGPGTDAAGTAGGTLSGTDPNTITGVVITSGTTASGYTFTDAAAELSGTVFVDANADGVQQAGDAGIGSVTVTLTGPVTRTLTTGTDGTFDATGLPAGTYTLTETQPAGYVSGINTAGTTTDGTVTGDTISAITVAPGATLPGYTFAEYQRASVSGTVRDDLGNPIGGVTITATPATGPAVTTTSASDGTWSLTLDPGTYTITETQPAGYGNGTATPGVPDGGTASTDGNSITGVTVVSGGKDTGYGFTDTTASISGAVYTDADGSGTFDSTESGLPGVTVTVLDGTTTVGSAITDAHGAWTVTGLLAGQTYTVVETQPAGLSSGTDTVGNASVAAGTAAADGVTFSGVQVGAGQHATGYLYGEYATSTIGGAVTDQGGKPVGGVTITIVDAAGNPVTTATTAADGTWSVTGLAPGTYSIVETQPAAYGDGTPVVGTGDGGSASGANTITGVTVTSGSTGTGYGFTDTSGSLTGAVYIDTNGNGVRDLGEPGIANDTIQISNAAGAVVATATTDSNGVWTVADLPAGSYTATQSEPTGYLDGADSAGTPAGDTTTQNVIASIPLGAGQNGTGYNFGEYRASSLTGFVVDDQGEGIGGVTVSIVNAAGTTVATTTTDPVTGSFTFGSLPPGTYSVVETQPAGYGDGTATPGNLGGNATGPNTISGVVLTSGASGSAYTFTDPASSITGSVYVDTNNDGTRQPAEIGIANVTVTVTDASGNTVGTTTTDANGDWTIYSLAAGTYTVTETQPALYAQGKDTAGTAGGDTSTQDVISDVVLGANVAASGYDFGEFVNASLAGTVATQNGTGIAGVTITVTDSTGTTVATVTSGAGGTWSVPVLPPGTYTITETQPAAYGDGSATAGSDGGSTDATTPNTITGVVVSSGDVGTGYAFTDTAGSLSGQVYVDANGDGTPAGDAGIANVTVTATSGGKAYTATTGADGGFVIKDLPAGTYVVTETQPSGYVSATDTVGTINAVTVGTDDGNGTSFSGVALPAGDDGTGYLFGEYVQPTVKGKVVDSNGSPISGVVITATSPTGTTYTATTNAQGAWTLTLPPGTYTITETQPTAYGDPTTGGATAGNLGGTPTDADTITGVTVSSGSKGTGYLFTDSLGSVSGRVYVDANGDGTYDNNEAGISPVTITVTNAAGTTVGTATTAADGTWSVTGLKAGTYTVTETQPAGYTSGKDSAGTPAGSTAVVNVTSGIQLAGGQNGTGYDFGEYVGATVSGTVQTDAGNGIGGVTITATPATGPAITTTTNADGTWSLTLPPGTYTITETQPAAYGNGSDTVGSVDGAPSGTITDANTISGVVVESGSTGTGYAFTDTTSSIAGRVFLDADGNGAFGTGDSGLATTITLRQGATVVATTTSSATDGTWSFTGLPAGTYRVVETQPTGYTSGIDTVGTAGGTDDGNGTSFSTITLPAATAATGYLFAEYKTSSITGTVTDSTGAPLAGVPVTISGPGLTTPITVNTGADGSYTVPNLPPGTYTVTETQPTGYGVGTSTPGTDGGTSTDGNTVTGVTVGSGSSGTGTGPSFVDTAASITGSVFVDANGDNALDNGERGVGTAVTLTLTNTTTGDVRVVTADPTTGAFSLTGLPAGTYTLVESQPLGYASGTDTPGSPANGTAATDGVTIGTIVVAAGSTNAGYLFPEYVVAPLSGEVKTDTGAPLAGVVITATGADGSSVSTTTGTDGTWSLTLPPGTYTITETQPAGYGDGSSIAGTVTGTGAAAGTSSGPNTITGVTLTSGSSGGDYTFIDTTSGLSGTVYADVDGDGVHDPSEPGIGNVTITVTDAAGTIVGQTTTASDGTWTVGGLPTGTYTVTETQPAGYGDGSAQAGTAGGTPAGDGNSITGVTLTTADPTGTGYDFGDTTGAVSGTVFYDADKNGVQDPGDPGIGGVTITVTSSTGKTYTTTTQPDGSWVVTALPAGTYSVTETQPAGYADGTNTVGSGGGTSVPPNTFTGVTVAAGEAEDGYTFAETRNAITGIAFLDVDRDGVYTPGVDVPEAGVTVTLTEPDGTTVEQVTDANGAYEFDGLAPGSYTVTETQPTGYGSDTPDTVTVALTTGATVDFGDQGATIGDTVWSDTNRNGVRDPGEPGVGGVTLTLYDSSGVALATTTSAADGSYSFQGLPAGTYTVGITLPSGQVLTGEDKETGTQTGSAFDPTTLKTAPITIAVSNAGVINDDLDADAGLAAAFGDITVTTSGPTGPVTVGTPVTGTITVTNDGNTTQPGATVTITVPTGQTPTTVGGSTYTCTATPTTSAGVTTITCTTTTPIPPGASAPPITIVTVPTQVGAKPVTVTVSPIAGGTDSVPTNDTTTIPITVVAGTSSTTPPPTTGNGGGTANGGGSGGSTGGPLPFTGLNASGLVGMAIFSMLSGLVLLLVGRRRRPRGQA